MGFSSVNHPAIGVFLWFSYGLPTVGATPFKRLKGTGVSDWWMIHQKHQKDGPEISQLDSATNGDMCIGNI